MCTGAWGWREGNKTAEAVAERDAPSELGGEPPRKQCPSHVDGQGSADAEAEGQTRGRDGNKIAKSVAESGVRSRSSESGAQLIANVSAVSVSQVSAQGVAENGIQDNRTPQCRKAPASNQLNFLIAQSAVGDSRFNVDSEELVGAVDEPWSSREDWALNGSSEGLTQ